MYRGMRRIVGAVVAAALLATWAYAQERDTNATIRELQTEQQQLRAEVSNLKAELQNIRKLLADLQKNLEAGGGAQPGAQTVTLSQLDKKLDRIATDIAGLKKDSAAPRTEVRRPATDFIGKPTPTFSLASQSGASVSNRDFARNRATVLNFVAPTCGFCARQIPKIEQVRAEYEPKGVRFVNVSEHMGDKIFTPDEAEAKYQSYGSNLELALDPDNKVGQLLKATSYPTMFVIRSDGVVAQVNIGAKDNIDQMLRQQLTALLGEQSPTAAAPGRTSD